MNRKQLQEQLITVKNLRKRVEDSLKSAPKGNLHAEMNKGKYPQYYLSGASEKSTERKYLKKENLDLVKRLAQKEYDRKFSQVLKQQEKALSYYLKNYSEEAFLKVYQDLSELKRIQVTPYILPDEQYLIKWQDNLSSVKNPFPKENGFLTERGEIVRSKSEKMIADKLYYMGIPYKYEEPLEINKIKTLFPDFTLLNLRKRKNIYLEHLGMMDNPEYCKKAIEKVELYQSNGFVLGVDLIITMESSLKGINMQNFEQVVKAACDCIITDKQNRTVHTLEHM